MRTLLNEVLPPHFNEFSPSQSFKRPSRIFSETAVLSTNEPMEVGVDRTVIATPGVCADPANNAPDRGLTTLRSHLGQLKESSAL